MGNATFKILWSFINVCGVVSICGGSETWWWIMVWRGEGDYHYSKEPWAYTFEYILSLKFSIIILFSRFFLLLENDILCDHVTFQL